MSARVSVMTESLDATASTVTPSGWRAGLNRAREAYRLEQRIMLDGAALAAADVALADVAEPASAADSEAQAATGFHDGGVIGAFGVLAEDDGLRREVVIVDTGIENYQALLVDIDGADEASLWSIDTATGLARFDSDDAERSLTVYAVDGDVHGLSGVTAALSNEDGVDTLHVLSHGDVAAVRFGGERLDAATLEASAEMLSQWGSALALDGDILLYGCDTGGDAAGLAFVQALAQATGADVAASDDPTGATDLGGDWELEVRSGRVDSQLIADDGAQAGFDGLLASTPTAAVSVPTGTFINESFTFEVSLDNTGSDTGYEPYVSVFTEPGVRIDSANYLGADVDAGALYRWDAASGAWQDAGGAELSEHPLNPGIPLPGDPGIDGMQWHIVEFPFGSFVADQPAATLSFAATLDKPAGALVGVPLAIRAQAGFEYGTDAFDNPDTDAPIVGALALASVVPEVLEIDKDAFSGGPNAVGDEDEHATGPNNPITWEVIVDIADGETIDNVVIEDVIGPDVHYLGNLSVSGAATMVGQVDSDATVGVSSNNVLQVGFASVTGTAGSSDIVIRYDGYIPEFDAANASIVDPVSGAPGTPVDNTVTLAGNYDGNAVTDSDTHQISPQSIATQKSVTILLADGSVAGRATTVPGDLLEWRLDVQVSDYFSLQDFVVTDDFGDGHVYVAGSERLSVFENGAASAEAAFGAANVVLGSIDPATGDTRVVYDVGAELAARGFDADGRLDGDLASEASQSGKTVFTIHFRTEVQEDFQYASVFNGDSSVDIGDRLENRESVAATVVASASAVADGSAAAVVVSTPDTAKSIYAIDGDTDGWDPADPELTPGQSVTYRITVTLPTSDVEALSVVDYLPLPVFAVPADYAYAGQFSGVDNVPAAGQYGFGPDTDPADFPPGFFDTGPDGELLIVDPVTTAASNSVRWDFASFDQDGSSGGTIDLLFTTVTQDVRFDDGLNLTNQAQISFDNTNNPIEPSTAIVQIETLAPELSIVKGAVALDAESSGSLSESALPASFQPAGSAGSAFSGTISSAALAATPIDADAVDIDADDVVRFALVIENSGGFEATDLAIADAFPAGFIIPAGGLNLQASLGDGSAVDVTGQLFDAAGNADASGLSFTQGGSTLSLARGHVDDVVASTGANVLVITYDLEIADTAAPDTVHENGAEILRFAAFDGGVDYTAGNSSAAWNDTAAATLRTLGIEKTLLSTGIENGGDNGREVAVAGETQTYQIVLTVPEGQLSNLRIEDYMASWMRFDSLVSVTASSGDINDNGTPIDLASASATANGRNLLIELGDVRNENGTDGTVETITIVYRTYLLSGVPDFTYQRNIADARWTRPGQADGTVSDGADGGSSVRVIEPKVEVSNIIVGTPPTDVGDTVTYSITIAHTADSDTDAFDLNFSDVLPSQLDSLQIDSISGPAAATAGFALASGELTNPDFDLAFGEVVTIQVSGQVASAVTGSAIENTASVTYSTLDNDNPDDGRDASDADERIATHADTVGFTVAPATLIKEVVSTGVATADNDATGEVSQGEYVQYRVTLSLPEGTMPHAALLDVLPNELRHDSAFVETITASPDVSWDGAPENPTVSGQTLRFDFGTIVNANRDNASEETITIDYRVYVASGTVGQVIQNTAELRWDLTGDTDPDDAGDGSSTASASVTFDEPLLSVEQTLVDVPSDAGDAVRYRIEIAHVPASERDAFDVGFLNQLPPQLRDVAIDPASITGAAISDFAVSGNQVVASDLNLALGDTIVFDIVATVDIGASAGQLVNNEPGITWSSLDDGQAQGVESAESSDTDTDADAYTLADPVLSRTVVSTGIASVANDDGELVAGEYVTHALSVQVPEGTTRLGELRDLLPAGMSYDTAYTPTLTTSAGVSSSFNASTDVSQSGQSISFDLGDVVNANTDDMPASLTITYRAFATDGVVDGQSLTANATFVWDADGDAGNQGPGDRSLSASQTLAVIHPQLELQQTLSTNPGEPVDAGDTVTYTYVISHTAASTADALDAAFTDALPDSVDIDSVSAVHSAAGDLGDGFSFTGRTVVNADYNLALNESITVTVVTTVNASVTASATVDNVAEIGWQTLDDDAADDGDESFERAGSASGSANFTVDGPGFDKVIVGTGIADGINDDGQVVAGEYIAYELRVTVPEGTTRDAVIVDTLDADTVYDAGQGASVTLAGTVVSGSPATPVYDASNDTLSFALGDIENTDTDDALPETLTIQYRVWTAQDATRGDVLSDNATLRWDVDGDGVNAGSDNGSASAGNAVTVIAPALIVENAVTGRPGEIGDPVAYEVTVRHTDGDAGRADSQTTAYDVTFDESFPTGVDGLAITGITDASGAAIDIAASGFSVDQAARTLTHAQGFDLAPGESYTLTLGGTAGAALVEGGAATAVADITWSTLDAGTAGDGNDAREASGSDSAAATFSLADITKNIVATGIDQGANGNAVVVAGEFVDYRIVVEVAQGDSADAAVIDRLDAGLQFQPGSLSVTPSGANLQSSSAFAGVTPVWDSASGTLTVELGDITNAATGGTVETLTIDYRAFVADSAAVPFSGAVGTQLGGDVAFVWDVDGDGTRAGSAVESTEASVAAVTFAEAELRVQSLLIDPSPASTPVDAGDILRFEVRIEHAPGSVVGAYDAAFLNALPPQLGDAVIVSALDDSGNSVAGFVVSPDGQQVRNPSFDLAEGDAIVLLIDATVQNSAQADNSYASPVTLAWQSLGDDLHGNQSVESAADDADSAGFTMDSLSFTRSVIDTGITSVANDDGALVAGEYVTYALTVTVPEGTTGAVSVSEALPGNLVFDAAFPPSVTGSAGVSLAGFDAATDVTLTGNTVMFDLGDVVNGNSDDSVEDTVTLLYRAYASTAVVDGDSLTTSATLLWDRNADGDNSDATDGTLAATQTLAVIHPQLQLAQTLSTSPAQPVDAGDTVTYTYVMSHTAASTADALDAAFSDTLPDSVDIDSVTAMHSSAGDISASFAHSGRTVQNSDFNLALNETITVTVVTTVNETVTAGSTVDNTAALEWRTLDAGVNDDGHEPVALTGSDSAAAAFDVDDPGFARSVFATGITSTANDDGELVAGEYVTYALTVTVPEGTTRMVVLNDVLSPNQRFDASFLPTVVGSNANVLATLDSVSNNGQSTTFTLGDVVNGNSDDAPASVTILYRAYAVDSVADGDVTEAVAGVVWDRDADGLNDAPDDGVLSASESLTIIHPELALSHNVATLPAGPADAGDAVVYTYELSHTAVSSADARDARFVDTLPDEIDIDSITAIDADGDDVSSLFTLSGRTVEAADFTLALGDTITLEVTGTINTGVIGGSDVANTADLSWQTLDEDIGPDGDEPSERSGATSAAASFQVDGVRFERAIVATGIDSPGNALDVVTHGEFVEMRLTITVPEGTTEQLRVTETLDAGLVFDPDFPIQATGSSGVSFTGTPQSPTVFGDTVVFELPGITNVDTDDAQADTVTLIYRAYVDATDAPTGLSAGAQLGTASELVYDSDADGSVDTTLQDADSVLFAEPVLQFAHEVVTVPGDTGDTVGYRLLVSHASASSSDAFDLQLTSDLPPGITGVSVTQAYIADGTGTTVPVSGALVSGDAANGFRVVLDGIDLAAGQALTLDIAGTAGADVVEGTTLTANGALEWSSLDAQSLDGQRGAAGPGTPGPDTTESTLGVSADAALSIADIAKTIVATGIDDATNDDSELVAGEWVDYRIVVDVPHGRSVDAAVIDELDAGLVFDAATPIRVTLSAPDLVSTQPLSNAVADYDADTRTVTFELGELDNGATASEVRTVTIDYRAYAADSAAGEPASTLSAAPGTLLAGDARFVRDVDGNGSRDDAVDATATAVALLTVIAPDLSIDHRVSTVPSDTGDIVRYTLAVQHTAASGADAHDIRLIDTMPDGIESVRIVSALDAAGDGVPGFSVSGNTVSHDSLDLQVGDTLTLVIEGVVGQALVEGDTITADADIRWSSLDEGAPDDGVDEAERVYSAADSASFSTGDIVKRIIGSGIDDVAAGGSNGIDAAVTGEWVDYEIVVEMPQGTTSLAELSDQLDAGVVFDAARGISVVPSSGALSTSMGAGDFSDASATYDAAADRVTVALGDIVNAAPLGQVEALTVTYRVYVEHDDVAAAAGTVLDANAVNFRWDIDADGSNTGALDGSTDASAGPLTILAAQLDVDVQIERMPSDHGDRIDYVWTIAHTDASTAAAYDVGFVDELPPGLQELSLVSAVDAAGNAVAGFSLDGHTLAQASTDLELGDTLTVRVSATVGPDTPVGDSVSTTASITWGSLDADDADDGADVLDPANERGGEAVDDTAFSIADLTRTLLGTGLDNAANGAAEVVPGEYVDVQVVVALPEGAMPMSTLLETLPPGLVFDSVRSLQVSDAGVTSSLGALDNVLLPQAGAAGVLRFDLGDLQNADSTAGVTQTLTLVYRASVADALVMSTGATLAGGSEFRYGLDGSTEDGATVLTVVEPVLDLAKSFDDIDPHLGQRVALSLAISNPDEGTGGSDAYDVTLRDLLPPELTLDPDSIRIDGQPLAAFPGVTDRTVGNTLDLMFDRIGEGQTVNVTLAATVTDAPARANAEVGSVATLDWSSLARSNVDDGDESLERSYATRADATLVPVVPDYRVQVSSDADAALPTGAPIEHTIVLQNIGSHAGTGVVVRVPWPAGTLDAPSSVSGGGAYDAATGQVVWQIGTLDTDEELTFTVASTVQQPQDADTDADPATVDDVFTLVPAVSDDASKGQDPNPGDNSASISDTVVAAPDYAVTIDNAIERASPTQEVPYAIELINNGDQQGTGVVVVHRFDPALVRIIEADGGEVVVDEASGTGTVTWRLESLASSESVRFDIVAEVLPTAFLDTADQLFQGRVEVNDDGLNGADPTADDNEAAHADMLLGGPGDPAALIGVVDIDTGGDPQANMNEGTMLGGPDVFASPRTSVLTSLQGPLFDETRLLSQEAIRGDSNEPGMLDSRTLTGDAADTGGRLLTPEHLLGDAADTVHPGEDDPVHGGELLDVFRNDVQTCEALGIDWHRYETTPADLGLEPAATNDSEQRIRSAIAGLRGAPISELLGTFGAALHATDSDEPAAADSTRPGESADAVQVRASKAA